MYQAHVAEAAKPSRSPQSCAETPVPEPSATSAAPPNASAAAIQKRELSRSIPSRRAKIPVITGSVPNRSATVVAVVSLIA